MPCSGAFHSSRVTAARSVLHQIFWPYFLLPKQLLCFFFFMILAFFQQQILNSTTSASHLAKQTAFPYDSHFAWMFLHRLFSICSIAHITLQYERKCFKKQCSKSDSSWEILGLSSKCFPLVSPHLPSGFFVCTASNCGGPVGGEWKVSTMDKGTCGTLHSFLLYPTAVIVWKCCRQLLLCVENSQTVGNIPAFFPPKWNQWCLNI